MRYGYLQQLSALRHVDTVKTLKLRKSIGTVKKRGWSDQAGVSVSQIAADLLRFLFWRRHLQDSQWVAPKTENIQWAASWLSKWLIAVSRQRSEWGRHSNKSLSKVNFDSRVLAVYRSEDWRGCANVHLTQLCKSSEGLTQGRPWLWIYPNCNWGPHLRDYAMYLWPVSQRVEHGIFPTFRGNWLPEGLIFRCTSCVHTRSVTEALQVLRGGWMRPCQSQKSAHCAEPGCAARCFSTLVRLFRLAVSKVVLR